MITDIGSVEARSTRPQPNILFGKLIHPETLLSISFFKNGLTIKMHLVQIFWKHKLDYTHSVQVWVT